MEVSRKTTKEEFVRELNEKIEKACSEDDYERASAIRSEIREVEEGESSPEEFALLVFHYRLRELEGLK
jgi:excinuclease UvrABC nuclease subunit